MRQSFRVAQLSLALVLIALLAACAGSAPQNPTPATPITLNLQWVTQAQFAGYYVALDKGWYKKEGIELVIRPGGPDRSPVNAVRLGSAQFGTSLLADIIVANQDANDLISIMQVQQRNGLLLLAKKESGIAAPKDFAGKKVGIWLGSWEAQFNALMEKEGIAPNDFTLVSQGFSMDDFLKGDLDVASAMIYNEYYTVLESGIRPEDLNMINYDDYGLGFPGDVLFTSKDFARDNPAVCAGMVRASILGWQYAIKHPAEAVDIVLKYDTSGTQTREHQLSMMSEIAKLVKVDLTPVGYSDRADMQSAIETLYAYKVLRNQIDPDAVFTNTFWEQSQ